MRVHIIGDSHVRIFLQMDKFLKKTNKKISIFVKARSAVTLYRVVRDGLDILLNHKHERANIRESTEQIIPGDIIVFCFGYVDIINNMLKYDKYHNEKLVEQYVSLISTYCKSRNVIPIIQTDTIPQPWDSSHVHFGDLSSRIKLREWLSTCMIGYCKVFNVKTFRYCDHFQRSDHTFDSKLYGSEDNAHIGHGESKSLSCHGCSLCSGHSAQYVWNALNDTLNCKE